MSFKILPHVPEDQLYGYVDAVIAHIQASGVKHLVGPSETTMEGEWDTLMDIVKESQEICIRRGAPRVSVILMSDYKPSTGMTIDEKIHKYR